MRNACYELSMTERVEVQKIYIKNKEYWLAQDFTLIPVNHCVRCKKPFSAHTEEAVNYQGFGVSFARGAYSGLCPDCIKWYRKQKEQMPEPHHKVKSRILDYGDHIVLATESFSIWPDGVQIQGETEYRVYKKG
jgi:hypothetical protein